MVLAGKAGWQGPSVSPVAWTGPSRYVGRAPGTGAAPRAPVASRHLAGKGPPARTLPGGQGRWALSAAGSQHPAPAGTAMSPCPPHLGPGTTLAPPGEPVPQRKQSHGQEAEGAPEPDPAPRSASPVRRGAGPQPELLPAPSSAAPGTGREEAAWRPGRTGRPQDGPPPSPAGVRREAPPRRRSQRRQEEASARRTTAREAGRRPFPPLLFLPRRADAILKPPGCAPEARPPGTVNRWASDGRHAAPALSRGEGPVSQPGDPTATRGEGPHPPTPSSLQAAAGGLPPHPQTPQTRLPRGTHLLPAGSWPGANTGPTASAKASSEPPTAATLPAGPPQGSASPAQPCGPEGVREARQVRSSRPPAARPPARAATCRLSLHFHFPHPSGSHHLPWAGRRRDPNSAASACPRPPSQPRGA